MFDLIDVMQWAGLTTLAVVVYVLAFNVKSTVRRAGPYSVPNWNFHLKKFWAQRVLRKKALSDDEKSVDFQHFESEQFFGDNQLHSSQFIYGSDTTGNSLVLHLAIGKDGLAEVWLHLRLANGVWYALPAHPLLHSHKIGAINEDKFEIAGIVFQCMQPYQKWRISYAGLLRKVNSVAADDLHFVKFNFFWTMCGVPQHWPADWSDELKATALATEPWRHGFWWEYLSASGYGGFDQFGALYGQVHVTGSSLEAAQTQTLELNLPGVRQRRWTSYDQEKVRRSCTIVGVCPDGSVYVLGAHSLERNLSNAQFGHVRTANGHVAAIDWMDFHLAEFAEDPDHIPNVLNLSFTAEGRTFSTTVYTRIEDGLPLGGNVPRVWSENVVPAAIGLNGEHGDGLVRLWYAQNNASPVANVRGGPALLSASLQRPTRTKIAYWFSDNGAQSEAIAGGKGASLALLTAALKANDAGKEPLQFQVPSGFVLSSSAYDLQLSMHPEVRQAIAHIADVAFGKKDGDLQVACDRVVDLFVNTALEPEIEQIVAKYYRELTGQDESVRLAVRSSAVGEDGEDASSAGQNETLLGLRTLDEVWRAVRLCWASLYTQRSVEYRRQHLLPIDTQMALVVQLMVDAEVAGVMFTRDPHSGDPRKVLLTANWGLGESVVSGTVEPDSFVIAKKSASRPQLQILESHLGSKRHSIAMSANREETVVVSELSVSQQQQSCLTTDQILRLTDIGVKLEKLYGNSRDIEWALLDDQIYILQSRPITTTNVLSNWELLHEMDTAVMSRDDHFSFANIGEVLPDCVTPLTNSTIVEMLQRTTMKTIDNRFRYRVRFDDSFAQSHHRVMFNIYGVFLLMREKDISLQDRIQSIAVAGSSEYITADVHRVSLHRNGTSKGSKKMAALWDVIWSTWNNKSVVERTQRFMRMFAGRFNADNLIKDFGDHDSAQFIAEINFELDDVDRMEEIFCSHSHTSKVSTFSQIIAFSILAEGAEQLSPEHCSDIGLMLSSCSDVESAEVPAMLEEIANTIYMAGVTEEWLKVAPSEGEEWLNRNCAAAARMFRNFISRHGHRAFKEFELMSVTWGMRPEVIVEMIQTNCRHANDILISKSKRASLTNAQIIQQLRSPKKPITRRLIGYLLSLCHRSVQRRETTKSCIISYIHEMRKAYRHLATMLVKDGLLPDAELIFFLTRDELARLMKSAKPIGYNVSKSALIAKAQRRRRLYPSWNEMRFAEMNQYLAKPNNGGGEEVPLAATDSGDAVRGTSVSEGVVTARACVIKSFAEVGQIRAGDILVTHSTDIAWSMYFPILGGVVTELGGLISHGAVVAREYGLPCIVGAADATRRLRNGDRVTLNATKGLIYRVAGEESEA